MKPLSSTARDAATRGTCTPDGSAPPARWPTSSTMPPTTAPGVSHPPLVPPLDALVTIPNPLNG